MAWDPEQRKNAQIIAHVGHKLGASKREIHTALMAAMTESNLRNVHYGDRDSLGLFQQRAAWGSAAARTNPHKAAAMFFKGGAAGQRGLFDIANRGGMTKGQLAQAVQVSAFPDRYATFAGATGSLLRSLNVGGGHRTLGQVPSVNAMLPKSSSHPAGGDTVDIPSAQPYPLVDAAGAAQAALAAGGGSGMASNLPSLAQQAGITSSSGPLGALSFDGVTNPMSSLFMPGVDPSWGAGGGDGTFDPNAGTYDQNAGTTVGNFGPGGPGTAAVATFNAHTGSIANGNSLRDFAHLINQADTISLQEIYRKGPNLQQWLNQQGWGFFKGPTGTALAWNRDKYQASQFGNMDLNKQYRMPKGITQRYATYALMTDRQSGAKFWQVSVHLIPNAKRAGVSQGTRDAMWREQVDRLNGLVGQLEGSAPVIVGGDFNDRGTNTLKGMNANATGGIDHIFGTAGKVNYHGASIMKAFSDHNAVITRLGFGAAGGNAGGGGGGGNGGGGGGGFGGGGAWRNDVVGVASKFLGVPYVWGGTSASGLDCSGFVQLVYRKLGINLPRVSADQARSGKRVPLSQLQVGDLVAWDNSSRNVGADHIAIYIGKGRIMEAARPGTNVHISQIYDKGRAWGVRLGHAGARGARGGGGGGKRNLPKATPKRSLPPRGPSKKHRGRPGTTTKRPV